MARLILILVALIGLNSLWRWFLRASPAVVAQKLKSGLLWFVIVMLVVLTATGRMNWLLPVVGAFIAIIVRSLPYLLRFAPLLHRLWSRMQTNRATTSSPNCSTVEAQYVRMQLNHESGEISGEVIRGKFAGKQFYELTLSQLIQLFEECRANDDESAALVQAYLDRVHGNEWNKSSSEQTEGHTGFTGNDMSREEAYLLLGLTQDASKDEIIEAHRRLMQKFHPDRGGSHYLAVKINQAKDLLLKY